jgi:endonuclease/exonuclease/phosphatase family metal-dependent hydrolase
MTLKLLTTRCLTLGVVGLFHPALGVDIPVVTQTNVTIRVVAANLTTGNFQRYETPGLNILKGLKPDVVAIQEFNCTNSFGVNTEASISNMVATTFGTNFAYFRESGYSIPNGVISRYAITESNSWVDSDTGVNDRGFAMAKIDLPGTNDLYIVSVHLKASNGATDVTRRAAEAAEVTSLIQSSFGTNAWIVIAGDMNLYSDSEPAINTFKTYMSDSPVPADLSGDSDTNVGRNERYDRILVSFPLTNALVPVVLPSHTLPNGLVFVSTNYVPLSDVSPVQFGDSYTYLMQHMAVVKDLQISYAVTNFLSLDPPVLTFELPGVLRWQSLSNLTYTVLASTNFGDWDIIGTANSTTESFSFTNLIGADAQRFYRVSYP